MKHPSMESLLSYTEGKVTPELGRHLARCARCRDIAAAMQSAREFGSSEQAVLLSDVYETLQARMIAASEPRAIARGSASRHILEALEFYFGKKVAKSAGAAADHKPFFAAFLGRKAADALVQQTICG